MKKGSPDMYSRMAEIATTVGSADMVLQRFWKPKL